MKNLLLLALLAIGSSASADWRDTVKESMVDQTVIRCGDYNSYYWYTFTSPVNPEGDFLGATDYRETTCETQTRFEGDTSFKIPGFTSKPTMREPAECWKEIARTQMDVTTCCYESSEGPLVRPWLVCGVKGHPRAERKVRVDFIHKMTQIFEAKYQ